MPKRTAQNPYGLTTKQKIFVAEYLRNGFNATRAAETAGYSSSSYSALRTAGAQTLANPNVRACIDEVLDQYGLSAKQTIAMLAEQAQASMSDYVNNDGSFNRAAVADDKKGRRIKSFSFSTSHTENSRGSVTDTETVSVQLIDSQGALNTLAKYHGLLTDRVAVDLSVSLGEKLQSVLDRVYPAEESK